MTPCPRTMAERARRTKRELECIDAILDAVVLDPNAGPRAEWTLEATVSGDRVPPAAVAVLADQGCGLVSTTLRAPGVTRAVVAL